MLPSSQNMRFCITSSLGINKLALSNKSKLNVLPVYIRWVTTWLRSDPSQHYLSSLICFLRWAHDLCWPIRLNPRDVRVSLERSPFFTASHECQRNWWWNFFRQLCTSRGESGTDKCERVRPAQGERDVRGKLSPNDIIWAPKAVIFWIQFYSWMFSMNDLLNAIHIFSLSHYLSLSFKTVDFDFLRPKAKCL